MKIVFIAASAVLAASSQATLFFNSTTNANGAAERDLWMAAAGITAPDITVDFESFALSTNMNNFDHEGTLVTRNTGSGLLDVRGAGAFGSSNPIGTKGMWHNETQFLVLDFTEGAVDYVGGWDIDQSGGTIRVTFDNAEIQTFSLEGTGGSGNSAEYWGLVSNDGRKFSKLEFGVTGDSSWGLDNIQYNDAVPEPATMTILTLAALAIAKKRKRK